MKAFCQAHKKGLLWGLIGLLVLWAVWYARPLTVEDLMGGRMPEHLEIYVYPQSDFPRADRGSLSLTAGEPEMDAVWERLEEIRFHRNPLEIVLQFLPQGVRTTPVDSEKDYRLWFFALDGEYRTLLDLRFEMVYWWRQGPTGRELPLYVLRGQEAGRELGSVLWEMSQADNSI